jgi:cephalosporin-C deacetylase
MYLTKKSVLLACFFSFSLSSVFGIDITTNWKFSKGDNPDWASPKFDDVAWMSVPLGMTWETFLAEEYDGFAWYRKTLFIPSSMKKEVRKYGALYVNLGKIDDSEATYFNGKKIGQNGDFPPNYEGAYGTERRYFIPASEIHWDQNNVIAVRVFDNGGGGGMYEGNYQFEAVTWREKIGLQINYPHDKSNFVDNQPINIEIALHNQSNENIDGTVTSEITKYDGTQVSEKNNPLAISSNSVEKIKLTLDALSPGFYFINTTFQGKENARLTAKKGFAIAPEKMLVAPTLPSDFDTFWQKTTTELANVAPDYKVEKQPNKCTATHDVYLVEMRSLGNVRVHGWYSVPKNAKTKLPALLHVQGYSANLNEDTREPDMVTFSLNIRGHGNSKEDINPGFPGFLLSGIEQKESYIYRGAYMDCLRAIDFLVSRNEVDLSKIAVEGGSQGGALSYITAALDKRVAYCLADVPFLSDFPNYFKIAKWPAKEFEDYVYKGKKDWKKVYAVLNYFDIKNFTPRVTCPVLMGVGLLDETCPPAINFAAFNNLASKDKSYLLYPTSGHALSGEHGVLKMQWLRTQLAIK